MEVRERTRHACWEDSCKNLEGPEQPQTETATPGQGAAQGQNPGGDPVSWTWFPFLETLNTEFSKSTCGAPCAYMVSHSSHQVRKGRMTATININDTQD